MNNRVAADILFLGVIIAVPIDLILKHPFISQQVCIITMLIVGLSLIFKKDK